MGNLCKGILIGAVAGMVVGGVIVAKNKKLQNKIKSAMSGATEKFEEAKSMLEEKVQELEQNSMSSDTENMDMNLDKMNKKSKK